MNSISELEVINILWLVIHTRLYDYCVNSTSLLIINTLNADNLPMTVALYICIILYVEGV